MQSILENSGTWGKCPAKLCDDLVKKVDLEGRAGAICADRTVFCGDKAGR